MHQIKVRPGDKSPGSQQANDTGGSWNIKVSQHLKCINIGLDTSKGKYQRKPNQWFVFYQYNKKKKGEYRSKSIQKNVYKDSE